MIILGLLYSLPPTAHTFIHMCLALFYGCPVFTWLDNLFYHSIIDATWFPDSCYCKQCCCEPHTLISGHWPESSCRTNSQHWTCRSHICTQCAQFAQKNSLNSSALPLWPGNGKTQGRRWISKGTLMHPHEYTAFLSITMLWDGPCL